MTTTPSTLASRERSAPRLTHLAGTTLVAIAAGIATGATSPSEASSGDWYVVDAPETMLHARPHATDGSYPVRTADLGTPLFVVGFENGSAEVQVEPDVDRGLLRLDDAVELVDDRVLVRTATAIQAPDLRHRLADGRPDPAEARTAIRPLAGGEQVRVIDRFDVAGDTWILVEPPADTVLYVRGGRIRPARGEEVPAPRRAAGTDTEVVFEDGVRGNWRVVRRSGQSIRTGPGTDANYGMRTLEKGDVVAVVGTGRNGWCRVRLQGPALDEVRLLLKSAPGAIEIQGDEATIVRGRHELRAINRQLDPGPRPVPANAYLPLMEAKVGDRLHVTDRIEDAEGDLWLEVVPPTAVVGWIHQGYLAPVEADRVPVPGGRDAHGRRRYVLPGSGDTTADAVQSPTAPATTAEPLRTASDSGQESANETSPGAPEETSNDASTPSETIADTPDAATPTSTADPGTPATAPAPPPAVEEPATDDGSEATAKDRPEVDLRDAEQRDAPAEIVIVPAEEEEKEAPEIATTDALDRVTFEDAERTYREIRRAPRHESELEAIEIVFLAIADRPENSEAERSRARTRAEQIRIQRALQARVDRLQRLEERTAVDRGRIEAIRQALLDRADYTAIGRLSRSRVYDGRRLPRLYRLEDPGSGRTLAYVTPDEDLRIDAGVGRIVGIVGIERQDPGRRIRIITPERFEIDLTEEIARD